MRYWNPGINQEANSFTTRDALGTTSPLSPSSTTQYALKIPENAVRIVFYTTNSNVQVRISSDDTAYFIIPPNTAFSLPVATLDMIYVTVPAAAVLNFAFLVI